MSVSAIVRVIAVAAVFVAAPAIADNARWSPSTPLWGGYYAATPLDECRRTAGGELELRACLSRLLLEAESHYDIAFNRLDAMVSGREDQFRRAGEAEALRFARETWRSYLDFQCDFEGAMLGQTFAERNLQATSCRVALLRSQRARLTELAAQIDSGFVYPGTPGAPGAGDSEACEGPFCAVESETFQQWTARCRRGGLCGAFTTAGGADREDHRLELRARPTGRGYDIVFTSTAHPVDGARAISVRVDGRNPVVFRPQTHYAADASGAFVLSDADSTARLVDAMRRGGRLTVQYVDARGQDRMATFSLMGVTRSLEWIEVRVIRPRY
ncbi:DUF1311 domain-containing protein [Alkalicaulis satelles]|uniref:DUF1311 domain-containing protein n=1 Tax=Alkalicaulis satelles TaxID=2609175 RepID=A0A5M6ZGG4_9PROT|nr:lysozyme inhibitor LprI family protein [Alkalicaulis satelles]KAA5802208.1 DUF1311 domain-containing protein [Alkalicaulis satelles]